MKFAEIDVEEETKQAMEAAIFNFNSLHSRAGRMTAWVYGNINIEPRKIGEG